MEFGDVVAFIVLFVVIMVGIGTCNSCLDEFDTKKKKLNDSYVSSCFPLIFDKEIEIDEVKYVICHTEPGSKDYKIKELVK